MSMKQRPDVIANSPKATAPISDHLTRKNASMSLRPSRRGPQRSVIVQQGKMLRCHYEAVRPRPSPIVPTGQIQTSGDCHAALAKTTRVMLLLNVRSRSNVRKSSQGAEDHAATSNRTTKAYRDVQRLLRCARNDIEKFAFARYLFKVKCPIVTLSEVEESVKKELSINRFHSFVMCRPVYSCACNDIDNFITFGIIGDES